MFCRQLDQFYTDNVSIYGGAIYWRRYNFCLLQEQKLFPRLASEGNEVRKLKAMEEEQKKREDLLESGEMNVGEFLTQSYEKLQDLYTESDCISGSKHFDM